MKVFFYINHMKNNVFHIKPPKNYKCLSTQIQKTEKTATTVDPNIVFSEALQNAPEEITTNLLKSMKIYDNFLSEEEENSIFQEIEPYLKRMRYEYDHWDDAIHGFRETERLQWNGENTAILDRVRKLAFEKINVEPIKYVHVLDLSENGYIKPHIDAVRFCGDTIAGMSLLSDSVMRLVHEKRKEFHLDVLLKRRSLYVMRDTARYDYTHEILKSDQSLFKSKPVARQRRISVICRNEPMQPSLNNN